MRHLIIRTEREEYDVSEIRGMTVEELIEKLRHYDPKSIVALTMDSGMYGGVHETTMCGFNECDGFREVNR